VADGVVTERLLLRPWSRDDLEALSAVFARPEVWRFPLRRGLSTEETGAFLDRRLAEQQVEAAPPLWAAERRDTGRLIGYVGLSVPTFLPEVLPAVEVGWRLDPDHWGQGLAPEGASAAVEHGFGILGLDEIVSICEPDNVASERVMQKIGMSLERETVHPAFRVPLRVYRITRQP
jgi:RimJ/RimL family protein N-acetyltransferase